MRRVVSSDVQQSLLRRRPLTYYERCQDVIPWPEVFHFNGCYCTIPSTDMVVSAIWGGWGWGCKEGMNTHKSMERVATCVAYLAALELDIHLVACAFILTADSGCLCGLTKKLRRGNSVLQLSEWFGLTANPELHTTSAITTSQSLV